MSDPRQAVLCEIFAETSLGIFADTEADDFAYDFGRTFLDPRSCERSGEAQYGGASGPEEGTPFGFAPDGEMTSP